MSEVDWEMKWAETRNPILRGSSLAHAVLRDDCPPRGIERPLKARVQAAADTAHELTEQLLALVAELP